MLHPTHFLELALSGALALTACSDSRAPFLAAGCDPGDAASRDAGTSTSVAGRATAPPCRAVRQPPGGEGTPLPGEPGGPVDPTAAGGASGSGGSTDVSGAGGAGDATGAGGVGRSSGGAMPIDGNGGDFGLGSGGQPSGN